MSAAICRKRLGFEEILDSPSHVPSAKRSRCLGYGSLILTAQFGFSLEDKIGISKSLNLGMFRMKGYRNDEKGIREVISWLLICSCWLGISYRLFNHFTGILHMKSETC
ncbi:hypothetical protein HPP92_001429 [Vanilla planifolia]|uniref:Uncharacterized protein n=1 Tax=Vanilla planifolia TaxID=51239 RepID=A0A835SBX8_VANPL|nr:hypothetical protein HPP92_001684 [Vanilla planifolia]KAG0501357.1 hypothetical protein HPP92_001429 [Vanilla planifolia]